MTGAEELSGIRRLVLEAIPTATPTDSELLSLTKGLLFDESKFEVVEREKQRKLVLDIARDLTKAYDKLFQLHPSVKRELERSFKEYATDEGIRYFFEDEPYICNHQIKVLLQHILEGLQSGPIPKGGPNAKNDTLSYIDKMPVLTAQQKGGETWKKVALVNEARRFWAKFTSRPSSSKNWPPERPSAGPFYNFVEDLIEFHELGWNVEATFRARGALKSRADTWGREILPRCK